MKVEILWERLQQGHVILADGATGTLLQSMGLRSGECPELWNLKCPEKVRSVVKAYVAAGAEIVLTNTFGGSRWKLSRWGLADRVCEINERAAQLAREAAGEERWVAGSIGPTGRLLTPMGDLSEEQALEAFQEQAVALYQGGVDLILVETMTDLQEAVLAVRAAREYTPLPVIASMAFEKGARGYRTVMGVDIALAVQELTKAGAQILGTNCGAGIDEAIEIVEEMRRYTSLPLWAKPNAGVPQLVKGQTVYPHTPNYMANRVGALLEAGANIIGGCCGTTPDHIRAIAQILERLGSEG